MRLARPLRLLVLGLGLIVPALLPSATAGAPPEIRVESVTVEATDSAGADAQYDVKAFDPVTGNPVDATCDIPAGTAGSGEFLSPTWHYPLGTTTVTCTATVSGATGQGTVTVQDTTAPTISGVSDITMSTDSPGGIAVTYAPTATDLVDGSVSVTCSPVSGSTFPIGATPVNCTATDSHGNTANASFTVTVALIDTTPPTFTVPANISKEATGPSGAVVTWTIVATDNADLSPIVSCIPASGSTFPLGTTTVSCTASDASGNTSAPQTFTVTVVDTTKPNLSIPPDQTIETSTSSGASFSYTATATDFVDGGVPVSCAPPGFSFPVGVTTVSCTATDSHGNQATGSFKVTVVLVDHTPPTLSGVPANITVEANGPSGSKVNYASPSAVDNLDGPIALVTCTPPSGSTFPLGTTTVTCSATDSHGNTGSATFTIHVRDTTPPHLIVPADWSVYATTPSGIPRDEATVQDFLHAAIANDIVDPAPVVTNDTPAFLPVGVTVISFVARDASGNTTSGQAPLTVHPQPAAGTTPKPLPKPADRVPPDDVSNLTATPGDGVVKLAWTKPKASDFDHVIVLRSTTQAGASKETLYTGAATRFVDRVVENGVEYRYVVVAVDKAGNASAGAVVVAMPKRAMLRSPRDGARLRKPPRLVWLKVSDASYYNVQLFRGDRKILSVWPTKASFLMHRSWKYERTAYSLTRGLYRWYVWPGYGARADVDYGDMLGSSSFQVLR